MKYNKINTNLFLKNRKKFINKILPNSIALFYSSDFYSTCYDNNFCVKTNVDLFYLCGLDEQEIILLIFPDSKEEKFKEIIFIRKITEKIKIWEGNYLSKKKIRYITGIRSVYWINDFNNIVLSLLNQVKIIYLNCNIFTTYFNQFVKFVRDNCSFYVYKSSNKILQKLRLIKEPEELECIKKAVSITEQGLKRILSCIIPNVWEFEIEAELIYEFIKNRSESSYPPIIASGSNTNILHYNLNNKQCKSKELLLIDVGAKYSNYCSDITRVFPINGKFSKRQKEVYQAVLNIKQYAETLLSAGNSFQNYNIEIEKKVIEELLKIQLLNKNHSLSEHIFVYKKFFIHSISHHIGLHTHDCNDCIYDKFQKNMVLTIEPGIYIVNENIGIRLEDTYLVQEIGPAINLTESFPIEYKDIESLIGNR